jgi:capsule polysaccharide export protein KpsE/RkpR
MNLKSQFFAAAGAIALLSAPSAFAQDMTSPAAAEPAAETSATADMAAQGSTSAFTDAQVTSFANAMNDVQSLNNSFAPRVQAATDAEAKAQLQREMGAQMTTAVEAAGLSTEEYNQIAAAAQTDQALRARIGQAMQADAAAGADASATADAAGNPAMEPGADVEMDVEAGAETEG